MNAMGSVIMNRWEDNLMWNDIFNLIGLIITLGIILTGTWYGLKFQIGTKFSFELYPLKRFFIKNKK